MRRPLQILVLPVAKRDGIETIKSADREHWSQSRVEPRLFIGAFPFLSGRLRPASVPGKNEVCFCLIGGCQTAGRYVKHKLPGTEGERRLTIPISILA